MTYTKNTLLILTLLLLLFPSFQKRFTPISSKSLKGSFSFTPKPAFSDSLWWSGAYQEQYRKHMEDSAGFKSDLVRLYNQVDYSLFGIPHAALVVAGKKGYLFEEQYFNAYTGKDFAGPLYLQSKVNKLKFLQEHLWKEKGILLVVAHTPAKGFFYPEYIPGRYLKERSAETNYGFYARACREAGINQVDFNDWFLKMKETAPYMLYPKLGIHWSSYGSYLCADSLRKYLESKLGRSLPHMVVDRIEKDSVARDEDDDIARGLNLIWDPEQPALAYPKYHFEYDSLKPKPSALFVGDSFYWTWYYSDFIGNTFRNKEFWYYNQDIYPDNFTAPKNTGQIDYPAAILSHDVIVLLQTNGGYGELGYGWIDRAYDYFFPGPTPVKETLEKMRNSPEWLKNLEAKAKERNITLDAMCRMDAIYMEDQGLKEQQGKAWSK